MQPSTPVARPSALQLPHHARRPSSAAGGGTTSSHATSSPIAAAAPAAAALGSQLHAGATASGMGGAGPASGHPGDSGAGSIQRSSQEIAALATLRRPPSSRTPAQVHEAWGWLCAAHPRLFAEFGGAGNTGAAASVGRELCARLRLQSFTRREIVFEQGDQADSMYMLIRGAVSIWALPPDTFEEKEAAVVAAAGSAVTAAAASAATAAAAAAASPGTPLLHPGPALRRRCSFNSPAQQSLSPPGGMSPIQSRRASLMATGGGAGNSRHSVESAAGSTAGTAGAAGAAALNVALSRSTSPAPFTPVLGFARHVRNGSGGGGSGGSPMLSPRGSPPSGSPGASSHARVSSWGNASALASAAAAVAMAAPPSPSGASASTDPLPPPSPSLGHSGAGTAAGVATPHTPSTPLHSAQSAPQQLHSPSHSHSYSLTLSNPLYSKRTRRTEARETALDAPPVPLSLLSRASSLAMDPRRLRMQLLGSLRPGGVKTTFGEQGLLQGSGASSSGAVRSATIRAEEAPTEVLVLGKADFVALLQGSYHKDLDEKFRMLCSVHLFRALLAPMPPPPAAAAPAAAAAADEVAAAAVDGATEAAEAAEEHPPAPLVRMGTLSLDDGPALAQLSALSPAPAAAPTPMDPLTPGAELGGSDTGTDATDTGAAAAPPGSSSPSPGAAVEAGGIDPTTPAATYLRKLALYFESRTVPPRGWVVLPGAAASMVYAVVEGSVEIVHRMRVGGGGGGASGGAEQGQQGQQGQGESKDDATAAAHEGPKSGRRSKSSKSVPAAALAASSPGSGFGTGAGAAPGATCTVLLGVLGPGQCYGELDHLAPASGFHPFGLRARGSPVRLLVLAREDWTKRVVGVLLDRAALKQLKARDAWRARRAADLERGGLGQMLQLAQLAPAPCASGRASASLDPSAAAAAAGSFSPSASVASPSGGVVGRRGRHRGGRATSGWQSIRDLGEVALDQATKSAPVAGTEGQHAAERSFPAVQQPSSSALNASLSAAALRFSASAGMGTSNGGAATERLGSRAHGVGAGFAATAVAALAPGVSVTVEPSRLVSPSPSTARLLQAHRTSFATLPSAAAAAASPVDAPPSPRPQRYASRTGRLQGPSVAVVAAAAAAAASAASSEQKDASSSVPKSFRSSASSSALVGASFDSLASLLLRAQQQHSHSQAQPASPGAAGSLSRSASALPVAPALAGAGPRLSASSSFPSAVSALQGDDAAGAAAAAAAAASSAPSSLSLPAPLPASLALGRELAAPLTLRELDSSRQAILAREDRAAAAARLRARQKAARGRASRYAVGSYSLPSGRKPNMAAQRNLDELAALGVLPPRQLDAAAHSPPVPFMPRRPAPHAVSQSGEEADPLPEPFLVV